MNLDDLKKDWQSQIKTSQSRDQIKDTLKVLEQNIETTDKQIKRRDRLEIGIAILLIPVWIIGLFFSVSVIQSLGLLVAIAACILIPYKMTKAKQVEQPKDKSVIEYLRSERQKLLQQKDMLDSVFWWYLGPLGLSIGLITLGANVNEHGVPVVSSSLVGYLVFVVALYAGIYFMNKKAAKTKFEPLLMDIDSRIEDLTKHESHSSTLHKIQEFIAHHFVWFSIPFSALLAWVFHTMEKIGENTENPFEGGPNDVPITNMSRGIEIDIRQLIDDTNIPAPYNWKNDIVR